MTIPIIEANGARIPALGFGTWQLRGRPCVDAVKAALDIGYRHVDTARMYGNEREVGEGIRASGVKRDDIFLTTKVWRDDIASGALERSAEASLRDLDLGPADLDVEASVLGKPLLGDVEAGHQLQAQHQRRRDAGFGLGLHVEDAVDAEADEDLALLRLDVDVGCPHAQGFVEHGLQQLDDRGVFRCRRHA